MNHFKYRDASQVGAVQLTELSETKEFPPLVEKLPSLFLGTFLWPNPAAPHDINFLLGKFNQDGRRCVRLVSSNTSSSVPGREKQAVLWPEQCGAFFFKKKLEQWCFFFLSPKSHFENKKRPSGAADSLSWGVKVRRNFLLMCPVWYTLFSRGSWPNRSGTLTATQLFLESSWLYNRDTWVHCTLPRVSLELHHFTSSVYLIEKPLVIIWCFTADTVELKGGRFQQNTGGKCFLCMFICSIRRWTHMRAGEWVDALLMALFVGSKLACMFLWRVVLRISNIGAGCSDTGKATHFSGSFCAAKTRWRQS